MEPKFLRLIKNGTLQCGKIIDENGIKRFERVDAKDIDNISEDERAFATPSMGRAIFTIDKDGTVHNFKGVDSKIALERLGPMELANARHIEYSQEPGQYKVSAVVFCDKKPEIRINGTSPLEDVEIEGDVNTRMGKLGVKVPQIKYIREIPEDFCIRYGLPIQVDGSLDDFDSDYAVEDDQRKERLGSVFGPNYKQELGEGKRPETLREYLGRIGFLDSTQVQADIMSLGFSMDAFVEAVDRIYSRGQRYGQAERIMGSPFRITDLEASVKNKDIEKLESIMDYTEKHNPDFTQKIAESFGKNIAVIMNNGWEIDNFMMRQDFSLTGEFCDDAYFDIREKSDELNSRYQDRPYIAEAEKAGIKRRFSAQVMHVASCIKVVQDAMEMTGKSQEQIDSILDKYVDSFVSNLDYQKLGQLFNVAEQVVQGALMQEFSKDQDWIQKLAGANRKEGIILDDQVLNAHSKNEDYYKMVAGKITDRLRVRQAKVDAQNTHNEQNTDDEGR